MRNYVEQFYVYLNRIMQIINDIMHNNILPFISLMYIFFYPVVGIAITMTLFILADTIYAIYATIKLNGINSFRSTKFWNIHPKMFFSLGGLMLGFLVDKYVIGGAVFGISNIISKTISMLVIYNEIKSIDETSIKLGNKSVWVLLKELFNKTKDLKKDLNDII